MIYLDKVELEKAVINGDIRSEGVKVIEDVSKSGAVSVSSLIKHNDIIFAMESLELADYTYLRPFVENALLAIAHVAYNLHPKIKLSDIVDFIKKVYKITKGRDIGLDLHEMADGYKRRHEPSRAGKSYYVRMNIANITTKFVMEDVKNCSELSDDKASLLTNIMAYLKWILVLELTLGNISLSNGRMKALAGMVEDLFKARDAGLISNDLICNIETSFIELIN